MLLINIKNCYLDHEAFSYRIQCILNAMIYDMDSQKLKVCHYIALCKNHSEQKVIISVCVEIF